jgi:hypothetical protein
MGFDPGSDLLIVALINNILPLWPGVDRAVSIMFAHTYNLLQYLLQYLPQFIYISLTFTYLPFPQVSVFMLTAITVDRVVSIMFPLKMRAFRLKHARLVAGSGWVACVLLSVLPATGAPYFGDAFFGRTGKAINRCTG